VTLRGVSSLVVKLSLLAIGAVLRGGNTRLGWGSNPTASAAGLVVDRAWVGFRLEGFNMTRTPY
jgi:hypothetical protein